MRLIRRGAVALSMIFTVAATAHAASFTCAYTLSDGSFGTYSVDAADGTDATNQALALLNRDHPGAGFRLQCSAD